MKFIGNLNFERIDIKLFCIEEKQAYIERERKLIKIFF